MATPTLSIERAPDDHRHLGRCRRTGMLASGCCRSRRLAGPERSSRDGQTSRAKPCHTPQDAADGPLMHGDGIAQSRLRLPHREQTSRSAHSDRGCSTIVRGLLGDIGIDLVPAILVPDDKPTPHRALRQSVGAAYTDLETIFRIGQRPTLMGPPHRTPAVSGDDGPGV